MTTTVNYTCQFCHRGFSFAADTENVTALTRLGCNLKPNVCNECREVYDRKVEANYQLDAADGQCAKKIANKDPVAQGEVFRRWEQLAENGSAQLRTWVMKMTLAVRKADGLAPAREGKW